MNTTDYFVDDDCDHPMSLRLVRALRWFDWIDLPSLFVVLDIDGSHVGTSSADAAQAAIRRLVERGIVDKRNLERGPRWLHTGNASFEYRLRPQARKRYIARSRCIKGKRGQWRDSCETVNLSRLVGGK